MIPIEVYLQYGISGLALYLMYSIAYNHLSAIEEKLDEIIVLLKAQSD